MTTPSVPTATNIRPDQIVVVQGAVEYVRTASLIDGAELERRVKNALSSYPTDVPHTLINLSHAQVVPANPSQLSWEEAYIQSTFFPSKKNPERGPSFEAKNLTRSLPTLLALHPENPGAYRQIVEPEGEIAKGTVVRIVVKTFQSKDKNGRPREKLGFGLEAIILSTEEVPYAPRAGARNLNLSAFGITVSEPLLATKGVETEPQVGEVVGTDSSGLPAAPVAPAAPAAPVAPAAPAAPVQVAPVAPAAPVQVAPAAPAQPIVPVAAAYQVAGPTAPVAPAQPIAPVQVASNPDDPFAGTPAPSWGGVGIQAPA